jgi:hypothetical protein
MTNYRIIIGEVILRDVETGEILNDGEIIPFSHSNVIADSIDVAKYLVKEMGVKKYKLTKMDYLPVYFDYELN